MSPAVLFRRLRQAGLALRSTHDGRLAVEGPSEVVRTYLPAIRERKASLLAGACSLCRSELATRGGRCAWCDAVRGREAVYEPCSVAEQVYLVALQEAV